MANISISLQANTTSYVERLKDAGTQSKRTCIGIEKSFDKVAININKNLTSVEGSIDAVFNGLRQMKGGGYLVGLTAMGISVGAIGAQLHNMATNSILAQKQLELAANRAMMTTSEFEIHARAIGTSGMEMEKLGDIYKDIQDRIGDFATSGGGALKDFYETMASLSTETDLSIDKLQKMSSKEALGAMVAELERAGASGQQMTFVMESLASDSSNLYLLLKNNSKALKEMESRMAAIGNTPLIDSGVVVEMKVLEQNWNTLWDGFGVVAGNKLEGLYEGLNKVLIRMNKVIQQEAIDGEARDITKVVGNSLYNKGDHYEVDKDASYERSLQSEEATKRAIGLRKEAIALSEKLNKTRVNKSKNTSDHTTIAALEVILKQQQEITAEKKIQLDLELGKGSNANFKNVPKKTIGSVVGTDDKDAQTRLKEAESLRMQELQLDVRFAEDKRSGLLAQQTLEVEDLKKMYGAKYSEDENYQLRKAQLLIQQNESLRDLENQEANDGLTRKMEAYATKQEIDLAIATQELTQHQEYIASKRDLTEEDKNQELDFEQSVVNAKNALKQSEIDMAMGFVNQLSAGLKEGTAAQKVAFGIEKSIVMASMAMKMEENAIKAKAAAGSGVAGEIASTVSYIADGIKIATVAATTIGQFHSGVDEVDQTGSYILKAGERVVQETANKDLTSFLDNKSSNQDSMVINSDLVIQGDTTIDDAKFNSMLAKHRESLAKFVNLAKRESPSL